MRFVLGRAAPPADKGRAPTEESPLERAPDEPVPPFPLQPLREAVARGTARGLATVRGAEAPPWAVTVGDARQGALAQFPAGAVPCSDDLMECVVGRVGLAPSATAVLALEPEGALAVVRDRLGPGPWVPAVALDAVRDAGAAVLRGIFAALLGEGVAVDPVRLEEDTLTATLLRTHAPPDAALLSLEIGLVGARDAVRAVLLVLADRKGLETMLAGL